MTLRIVQLGERRAPGEGLRIGAVRYPPRGLPRSEWSRRAIYDLWLPVLAPSADLLRARRAADAQDPQAWRRFARAYRREMRAAAPRQVIGLLAALSRGANLALGCYCLDVNRCHRSILRELLGTEGADLA